MNRMSRAAALAAAMIVCAGCESLAFQKWSPSARSTRDNPGVGEVYWGANAEFVVLDQDQVGRPVRQSSVASRDVLDVWNTPIPPEETARTPDTGVRSETARIPAD